MESEGFTSYQARGIAARSTRDPKTDDSPESLLLRWYNELDSIGWPTRKINQRLQIVQDQARRPLRRLGASERAEMVRGLLVGPLAEHKAFTRADVVRLAAPALYGARSRAYVAASVLAAEAAVEDVAARLAGADDRARVSRDTAGGAVAAREAGFGERLTIGQRRAVAMICGSGRGLDVVVGVAGSGKTTALEVVRSAFEDDGYRVLGTAVSGQAARALATEAGVDSRAVASLVWRLEHGTLTLDRTTLLLIDEAGMTEDAQLLKLLVAVEAAGAKAVMIGDHHQLGAVGPGGGLEALVARHDPAVVVLGHNVRQRDPAERTALEQLRAGDVGRAVAWYRDNDRIVATPVRTDAIDAAVDAWDADRRAGLDVALLAWLRRDVAALNERARQRRLDAGVVAGPEAEGAGGRRYAAGDRVVFLAPGNGRWATSERAKVVAVSEDRLTVAFDDGRREESNFEQPSSKIEVSLIDRRKWGMPEGELGTRSHRLFGRQHRLALWSAIAARKPGEAFTNSELVRQVHLTSGEVSKELPVLVDVGLLTTGKRSGTTPFHRTDSGFWDGCLALHHEWAGSDGADGEVIPFR